VIGSLFLRQPDEMLIDLRSCERAVAAVEFFDRHFSRDIVEVTRAAVVNKLMSAENAHLTPTDIFDHESITDIDPEGAVQQIKHLVANVQDPAERFRLALEDSQTRAKQPLPAIERFPVHFYEDGLQSFETTLKIRQIIAMQHWLGDRDYSMHDAIQSAIRRR
jgi:hypothetical protein